MPKVDRRALREELKERIADWRAPLTQHVAQARQLLRKVLADRLAVTPEPGGGPLRRHHGRQHVYEDSGRNCVSKGRGVPRGIRPGRMPIPGGRIGGPAGGLTSAATILK
jgi:hypothetical protein